MNDNQAVVIQNITKKYSLISGTKPTVKDIFSKKSNAKQFQALKQLSITIEKGDSVGLLGVNGSGKSTLANIIGGISTPSSGTIKTNGEVALISVGTGLNGHLTGIENIEMKGLMLGFTMQEINEIKDEIIEFSDIGDFVYEPVKTYSSGMKSRLGFAIAVTINPDIIIIDEALSVGDPTFTKKCLDKMNEFRENGKTIFFVSHSTSQVKSFCNKALWLEYGMLKAYGDSEDVIPRYEDFINRYNKMSTEDRALYKKEVTKNFN